VITAEEALAILLGLVDLESLEQIEYVNSRGVGSVVDDLAPGNKDIRDQFSACLTALSDELQKGPRSALKLDYALSKGTDIYITLDSFRAWAVDRVLPAKLPRGAQLTLHSFNESEKYRQSPAGGLPGAAEVANQAEVSVSSTKEKKRRDKGIRQQNAILAALREKKFDLLALPRSPSGFAGVRSEIYEVLKDSPLFGTPKVYETAWQRCLDLKLFSYQAAPTPLQQED
jgi:hypothetical protein